MSAVPRIRIDLASGVPAIRQIADNLRISLVEGALKPGTPLPSVRRLAIELGVHFNTVAEAYRQLAEEGWLDLKHGRAAIVMERTLEQPTPTAAGEKIADFRQRMRQLISQLRADGVPSASIAAELKNLAGGLK